LGIGCGSKGAFSGGACDGFLSVCFGEADADSGSSDLAFEYFDGEAPADFDSACDDSEIPALSPDFGLDVFAAT